MIFLGLMETAYYKEKIATNYEPGLASGKYHKVSFSYALDKMMELSQKYDIKQFSAYNVNFDLRALNNTAWTYLGYELDFSSYDIVLYSGISGVYTNDTKRIRPILSRAFVND